MKLDNKKLRLALFGLVGLALIIFFAVLIAGLSLVTNKSNQVVDRKLQENRLQAQLSSLAIAKKEVEQYSYFKDVAKTVIPNDKDQAQSVLDIFQMAAESGISIQNITFPDSNLGAAGTTGTTSASGSSSKALSQAKTVEGIPGVYSLELTIVPESSLELPEEKLITYPKLIKFLKKLENNRRTAQITEVIVQPLGNETGPSPYINFSLTVHIFIKP